MEKKIRRAFSTKVLERFMSKEDLVEMDEMYSANLRVAQINKQETSDEDRQVLAMFQAGLGISAIAKNKKWSDAKVRGALLRAALERVS